MLNSVYVCGFFNTCVCVGKIVGVFRAGGKSKATRTRPTRHLSGAEKLLSEFKQSNNVMFVKLWIEVFRMFLKSFEYEECYYLRNFCFKCLC